MTARVFVNKRPDVQLFIGARHIDAVTKNGHQHKRNGGRQKNGCQSRVLLQQQREQQQRLCKVDEQRQHLVDVQQRLG